jgi:hypothetical protein
MNGMRVLQYVFSAVLMIALCTGAQAQTTVYGVHYGMGKSTLSLENEEPLFISPLNDDFEDFVQIGLDYMYAPRNTSIFFKSGLMYNARTSTETAVDYLRAPLGVDIGIGNTFQFIIGANVFTSFLLAHSGFENNEDFINGMQRLQFGWGGNFGFGLGLSRKVHLNVMYQRWFDITEAYGVETRTQEGYVTENLFGQDGLLRMGLQYRIVQP